MFRKVLSFLLVKTLATTPSTVAHSPMCAAASFAGMTVAGSALAIAKIACEMMREASEREIRFMGPILAK